MTTDLVKQDAPVPAVGFDRFIEMALNKSVPVETLERLLAMQREIMATNAKADFDRAMAEFQAACPIIPKNEKAGSGNFSYDYAPMDLIIKTVGRAIADHGFSYTFDTEIDETSLTSIMTIKHIAGHAEKFRFRVPIDKAARMNDTQKVGSANTYAQRYNFKNGFGIMTGDRDDDGAHATPGAAGHPKPAPAQQTTPQAAPHSTTPAPQPQEMPTGQLTVKGYVSNITPLPLPKKPGSFRYKIELADHEKPFYTFDKKIKEYLDKYASAGEVTFVYEVSKYGQDIKSVSSSDVNADFAAFCKEAGNA